MCWDHVPPCVGGHVYMCWRSCIHVLGVMYLCVA